MTAPHRPPADRFCDLVMKGGIASGVVYPKVIVGLSRHYHFHSIGGTSVGAIAAALTAAAEYQRRRTGSDAGFVQLDGLATALATKRGGRSQLRSLFQPQPGTRRLFNVVVGSLNRVKPSTRTLAIVKSLLVAYWPATLLAMLLAVLAGMGAAAAFGASTAVNVGLVVLVAALALPLFVVVLVGGWLYRDLTRNLVDNGYGLCRGNTEPGEPDGLVPWLHQRIQDAAGLPLDEPLTFGHLWHADEPPAWTGVAKDGWHAIDLRMFTTNLGYGRPHLLPLPKPERPGYRPSDGERLFYAPTELAPYLPESVMKCIDRCSSPAPAAAVSNKGEPLRELPLPEDFPVLLAARMSLSFPLLISAVPLYALDPETSMPRLCWFSDGGISSNFPLHLFDGLVPRWPTFGIDLDDVEPGEVERKPVELPDHYDEGRDDRWNRWALRPAHAGRLAGFLFAIVGAAQNWNDNTLARMPGFRDRVARVKLARGEGGLNLDMEPRVIGRLEERGGLAASAIVDRFVPHEGDATTPAWDEHRWVRLNVLLKMFEARAAAVQSALDDTLPHATSFDTLFARLMRPGAPVPAGCVQAFTATQQEVLDQSMKALGVLCSTLARRSADNPFRAIPKPELRVRPPL